MPSSVCRCVHACTFTCSTRVHMYAHFMCMWRAEVNSTCLPQSFLHCICFETRSLVNLELTNSLVSLRDCPVSDHPALGLQVQTVALACEGWWGPRSLRQQGKHPLTEPSFEPRIVFFPSWFFFFLRTQFLFISYEIKTTLGVVIRKCSREVLTAELG